MLQVKKIIRPVSKEFRKTNCGFDHTPPDDFVKSQWQNCTKSIIYLVYRWLVAVFFIAVVLTSMLDHEMNGYYFIFLTNWGILMCMFTHLLGAILVTIWHYHPEYAENITNSNSMPNAFKVYWVMHVTTLIASIMITIVYWGILYTSDIPLTATNVLTHAFNAAIMFLDFIIVAYPLRLFHIFLPVLFGTTYALFSLIYYLSGGLHPNGSPYIYTVLDWTKPGETITTLIALLLLTSFIYILIFMIYKIRIVFYKKIILSRNTLPISNVNNSTLVTHPPLGISMVLGDYGYENRGFTGSTEKIPK